LNELSIIDCPSIRPPEATTARSEKGSGIIVRAKIEERDLLFAPCWWLRSIFANMGTSFLGG
jgi:hypothetical protein